MIKFRSIVECVVDHRRAGRYNNIDCQERNIKGLIGLSEDGDIFRYNYDTQDWTRLSVIERI